MKTTKQDIAKTNELQRLFEVYAIDIAKIWKRLPTGQIVMDMNFPYKPAWQIFEEFQYWMKLEKKMGRLK